VVRFWISRRFAPSQDGSLSPLLPVFILLTGLVNDSIAEYLATASSPLENRLILKKIVESVFQQGRFLTRGSAGIWVPISKEEALIKTTMALQYRARKLSTREQSSCGNVNTSHFLTPHTKSSHELPRGIFHPPIPRVIHVSSPFYLERPAVVVPRPIRLYSNCSTTEAQERCNLSYQHLRQWQELCNQANDHYLTARFAASNAQTSDPAGFPETYLHRQGEIYNTECMGSDRVLWGSGADTRPSSHHDAPQLMWTTSSALDACSTSDSLWEPIPFLDAHSETGRGVHSELPRYFTPICNGSLDPTQPLDCDW
jgi:hypothetical protein